MFAVIKLVWPNPVVTVPLMMPEAPPVKIETESYLSVKADESRVVVRVPESARLLNWKDDDPSRPPR